MRVFLVRHGQTDWNTLHKVQGHTNIPLNAVGMQQSRMLVEALSHESLQKVYCSDLIRCSYTAKMLADETGAELIETPLLRERNFGVLEGETFHVTTPFFNSMEKKGIPYVSIMPENGESIEMVWNRVNPIVEEIRGASCNIAVITHGGTCSILLAKLLNCGVECVPSFTFSNCSITEVKNMRNKYYKLIRYACAKHLK